LKYSAHNIFSRIRNSTDFFLVNTLTGNSDILNPDEAEKLEILRNGNSPGDPEFINELIDKGYMIDEQEEQKLYRQRYYDFIDYRDKDEIQIFFIPDYACNFSCSYCYQDEYINHKSSVSNKIVDAFFDHIRTAFAGKKKYITLFGGEPLLPSASHENIVRHIINKANEANLELCIVTNGYTLARYEGLLKTAHIREIQVTLDGTASVHNSRRFLKNGSGTFDEIVKGIDVCLKDGLTVNLRMVIDKENIDNLPDLAAFAIEKGWTTSPFFKTQLGRNYELHHCQKDPGKLFDRLSLHERLYELIRQNPHITEFYKPNFSIAKYIIENSRVPDPLFDACPALKTEWAFDYTGHIYPCTATVGKKDESVGTFYPSVSLDQEAAAAWEMRDVTTISGCKDCNLQLVCGGGCGSLAKNRCGKLLSTDCRPVKELLEIGFAVYPELI